MNVIDEIIYKYNILKYYNVTGYAKTFQKRQRKDKILDEVCIQIHVTKKVPLKELRKQDILPSMIEDIATDVVEFGEIKALPSAKNVGKTTRIRPLVAGISVGNASITAGTLGWFMEKTKSPDKGEVFLGSNAHVLSEEPKNKSSNEKRILQPGDYDGGTEVAAEYYWHKQLYPIAVPSECNLSRGVAYTLNVISELLGRKTRFLPVAEETNFIDFAVAKPIVPWEPSFFDVELPPNKFGFVGFGFAGSDQVSLGCRQDYILDEGYQPLNYEVADVSVGDVIHKTGRTSCYSKAPVKLESAYELINYGTYYCGFDDVIVIEGKLLSPGDSGSSLWTENI